MYTHEEIYQLVEKEVSSLQLGNEPHFLYEPIRYSMQEGGKRVRPVLLLMAANLFSDNIKPYLPAAIGVEMFHNFTLLHDDIMDNSPTRRGRDSVHKKWNRNVAILSGDAMMIYAYKLMLQSPIESLYKVLSEFNKLSLELCEGQQLDMDFESLEMVSMDEYINMISLKTSVLLAGALKIGAIIAGATESDCEKLYNFGLNLGVAFQIQDDILDAYSDANTLGKPIGGDIIEGKKSYIFLLCYKLADDNDKKELLLLLKDKNISDSDKIRKILFIYDKYEIKSISSLEVERYFQVAIDNIYTLNVAMERQNRLLAYTKALLARKK